MSLRWGATLLGGLVLAGGCSSPDLRVSEVDLANPVYERGSSPPEPGGQRSLKEQILARDELTLEDVLALADEVNPDLNQARRDIDLGNALVWGAGLYPNPSLVAALDDYHPHHGTWSTSKRTIGAGIPLVVGGRIQSNIRLAESQRDQLTLNYVWRRREILSQVKQAFQSVMAFQQGLDLTRQAVGIIRNFHTLAQDRFNLRAIPEMELLKATVELAKAETDERTAGKNLAVAVKTLKSLMGNLDLPREKFKGSLFPRFKLPALEDLTRKLEEKHPLLESARKEKEIHEREVDLLQASNIPDLAVQLLAGVDSGKETVIQAGLSVPLPIFDHNQAKLAIARIEVNRAEFLYQSQWNDLHLKLLQLHHEFEDAQARVVSYEGKILPSAQKAMEQTTEGYRQGKFNYLDVLDSQRTWLDARTSFVISLLDLNTAASELEKVVGSRIEPAP
jgi:cobalt-zinc-cadmium efflux system outer membrane protein